MRHVRFFEPRDLGLGQPNRERRQRVVEMRELRRADDRRGNLGLGQHPGERDLRARHAALGRDLGDALDHAAVGIVGVAVQGRAERVGCRALGRIVPVAR